MPLIQTSDISHHYDKHTVIYIPDIAIEKGETVLITGKSGSGKSTFLNILGGLIKPTHGNITINNVKIQSLSQSETDQFRANHIGIIFQKNHFVSALNVYENIALAAYLAGKKEDKTHITELVKSLQLDSKIKNRIETLSEGEKQRVSIARALVNKPLIILADEPTSALDDDNCSRVLNLLRNQAGEIGATLVIVTHDNRLKESIPNQINLQ